MTKRAQAEDLEPIWKALANPVRRAMLDELSDGPKTTGELDALFPDHSRFAVMQHLRVLERGGLVVYRRRGRERFNYLNPVPIQQIYHRWVSRYQQPWAEALTSLKWQLESEKRGAARKKPTRGKRA